MWCHAVVTAKIKYCKPMITGLYMSCDVMRAVWDTEQLQETERLHQVYCIAATPILLLRSPLTVETCRIHCMNDDVEASPVSATLANRIRCTDDVGHQ
jgi:hypothetical protein